MARVSISHVICNRFCRVLFWWLYIISVVARSLVGPRWAPCWPHELSIRDTLFPQSSIRQIYINSPSNIYMVPNVAGAQKKTQYGVAWFQKSGMGCYCCIADGQNGPKLRYSFNNHNLSIIEFRIDMISFYPGHELVTKWNLSKDSYCNIIIPCLLLIKSCFTLIILWSFWLILACIRKVLLCIQTMMYLRYMNDTHPCYFSVLIYILTFAGKFLLTVMYIRYHDDVTALENASRVTSPLWGNPLRCHITYANFEVFVVVTLNNLWIKKDGLRERGIFGVLIYPIYNVIVTLVTL